MWLCSMQGSREAQLDLLLTILFQLHPIPKRYSSRYG